MLPDAAALRDELIEQIAAPLFAQCRLRPHRHADLRGHGAVLRAASASRPTSSARRCTRFTDQGDRSLTLRPEGTAPVCRAYVEHGMHKLPQPVKLWYDGPFFRQEAPQAGRFRQFFQIGAEALGSDDPVLDAESIVLLARLLEARRRHGHASADRQPRLRRPSAPSTQRQLKDLSPRKREHSSRRTWSSGSTRTRCARSTPSTRARRP